MRDRRIPQNPKLSNASPSKQYYRGIVSTTILMIFENGYKN
jgi:hypothetical protein